MKKIWILIFWFIPYVSYSQDLSLDEIIMLHKKSFIDINDYLLKKGWDFSHSHKGGEDEFDIVVWSYGKSFDEKALSWFVLYSSSQTTDNIVSFQGSNNDNYDRIKSKINTYSMKIIDSGIEDNRIFSVFEGTNYVVILSMESNETGINSVQRTTLMRKEAYHLIQLSNFLKIIEEENAKQEITNSSNSEKINVYNGKYLYKSKTYTYAPLYKNIDLTDQISKIAPDDYVYVLEFSKSSVYKVWYNGIYGYIQKIMLKK